MRTAILSAGLILLGWLLYKNIDSQISIDHLSQRVAADEEARRESMRILEVTLKGKQKEDVEEIVRKVINRDLIKVEAQVIEAGSVVFRFQNGKCVSVEDLNR